MRQLGLSKDLVAADERSLVVARDLVRLGERRARLRVFEILVRKEKYPRAFWRENCLDDMVRKAITANASICRFMRPACACARVCVWCMPCVCA